MRKQTLNQESYFNLKKCMPLTKTINRDRAISTKTSLMKLIDTIEKTQKENYYNITLHAHPVFLRQSLLALNRFS